MSVPALRFKNDDGQEFPEWEEKTLGATLSIFSGYAFSSADSQDDGVKWLKIADVGIQQMTPNNISYLPIELKDKHSNFLVYKNDYVIALTRPILNGKLKIAKVDEFYDESLLNQRVGKLITAHDIDFIYFLLQHKNTISHIADTISGTDPPNLSLNAIKDICLIIPTNKIEQTKIANFLTAVDEKISILTQKADLLSQYKKGVMQQIFSQELRFKDDDGQEFPEWEEKTLGEIAKFRRGSFPQPYGLAKWYDDINGMPFIQVFDVDDNFRLKENTKRRISKEAQQQSVYVKSGSILVTIQGSIGRIAVTQYDAYVDRTLLLFESFKVDINKNYFAYILFLLFEIEKEKAPGGIIKTITKEVLTGFNVFICDYEEQTKIANFLSAIDEKITTNQTQLNAVKQYKQGLLQQMFV